MAYLNIFCIFLSLLIKVYSRSKKMFQLLTYIIPLDAIQHHRHSQIMKAGYTILWLIETLKLVSAISRFFTKWQPLNNYEKCFLFHLKNYIHSRDIQIFVFLFFPLFFLSAIGSEDDRREISKFITSAIV